MIDDEDIDRALRWLQFQSEKWFMFYRTREWALLSEQSRLRTRASLKIGWPKVDLQISRDSLTDQILSQLHLNKNPESRQVVAAFILIKGTIGRTKQEFKRFSIAGPYGCSNAY